MADTVQLTTSLAYLPLNTSSIPTPNYASTCVIAGILKTRWEQLVVPTGAPITLPISEFTTITVFQVFNLDTTNAVSVLYRPQTASGSTAHLVGAGGAFGGSCAVDSSTSPIFSTTATTGTSTVLIYVAGT